MDGYGIIGNNRAIGGGAAQHVAKKGSSRAAQKAVVSELGILLPI